MTKSLLPTKEWLDFQEQIGHKTCPDFFQIFDLTKKSSPDFVEDPRFLYYLLIENREILDFVVNALH